MPWVRQSDQAGLHPMVLSVFELGPVLGIELDEWSRANLVFGFVVRCATLSAAHLTDYWVGLGTLVTIGGPHWQRWADDATFAGYWAAQEKDGRPGYLIKQDMEFLHIKLKEEVEWERRQRRDLRNPALTVPVRHRDGDGCRYCAKVVNWRDRRGSMGGTYDHRTPTTGAETVDDLVISCKGCNSARSDHPNADEIRPLLPVPSEPYYGPDTVALLATHGITVTQMAAPPATPRPRAQRDNAPARPGPQPVPAPRDPAAGGTTQVDVTPHGTDLADRQGGRPRYAGSGRDRVGSGRDGPGQGRAGSGRRRSRRGRRSKPRPAGGGQ